jgi:protein NUD1
VEASSHGTSTSSVSVTEVIGSLRSSSSIQPAEKETNDSATGTAAIRDESPAPAGTFLVREEVEAVPFLPKTPGKAKVGGFANMFTPLALERMFDPPSPRANGQKLPVVTPGPSRKSPLTRSNIGTGATLPAHPSPLSQAHAPVPAVHITPDASCHSVESDSTTCERPEPGDANNNHLPTSQFTFTIPAPTSQSQLLTSSTVQAQSTPGPSRLPSGQQAYPSGYNAMLTPGIFAVNNTPAANPKLRLFQLQYDTFTREHLSAMADSIAVGSPSTSLPDSSLGIQSPSFPYALSRVTETSESPSILRMRATKRLKLSPNVDSSGAMSFATSGDQSHHFVRDQSSGFSRGTYGEGEGEGAVITRPKSPGHLQNKPPKFPMVGPKPILKRDYVRESRNLMQQIKSARDLSTSSSAASDGDVSPGNTSSEHFCCAYSQIYSISTVC